MASMAWKSITTSTATSALESEFAPPTGSSPLRQTKEAIKEFFNCHFWWNTHTLRAFLLGDSTEGTVSQFGARVRGLLDRVLEGRLTPDAVQVGPEGHADGGLQHVHHDAVTNQQAAAALKHPLDDHGSAAAAQPEGHRARHVHFLISEKEITMLVWLLRASGIRVLHDMDVETLVEIC